MNISIISLFPDMFSGVINASIIKRAIEKGKVSINLVNLRDFGIGRHKTVDDKPYGGGVGMVFKVDVMHAALKSVKKKDKNTKVILLDPRGIPFTQAVAEELSRLPSITLLCGHYEGYDERIREYIDMEISLGDFVLTGGEIPAMAVLDSVTRLLPGVLGKDESSHNESFSKNKTGKRVLEHPQYTRPQVYKNAAVPEELLLGNHEKIVELRDKRSIEITQEKRPDLLELD